MEKVPLEYLARGLSGLNVNHRVKVTGLCYLRQASRHMDAGAIASLTPSAAAAAKGCPMVRPLSP